MEIRIKIKFKIKSRDSRQQAKPIEAIGVGRGGIIGVLRRQVAHADVPEQAPISGVECGFDGVGFSGSAAQREAKGVVV